MEAQKTPTPWGGREEASLLAAEAPAPSDFPPAAQLQAQQPQQPTHLQQQAQVQHTHEQQLLQQQVPWRRQQGQQQKQFLLPISIPEASEATGARSALPASAAPQGTPQHHLLDHPRHHRGTCDMQSCCGGSLDLREQATAGAAAPAAGAPALTAATTAAPAQAAAATDKSAAVDSTSRMFHPYFKESPHLNNLGPSFLSSHSVNSTAAEGPCTGDAAARSGAVVETPDVAGVSVAPGCCSSPGDRGAACALPLGSLGLSAPKETEEEREDADSEQEDEAPPCCCLSPLLRSWFHAFFPNTPPFVWFFLQLFICFLLLLMGLERVATAKSATPPPPANVSAAPPHAVALLLPISLLLLLPVPLHLLQLQLEGSSYSECCTSCGSSSCRNKGNNSESSANNSSNSKYFGTMNNSRSNTNTTTSMQPIDAKIRNTIHTDERHDIQVETKHIHVKQIEFQHGMPAATAFAATVDPEIFYVPWSIFVYVWWLGNAKESHYMIYLKTTEEAPEPLMYFVLFGSSLLFTRSLFRVIQVTNMVLMVLAVRRLLLAVMVFCFELGFLMSMNAQVVHYLRRSSAVRKLNAKWLAALQTKESESSRVHPAEVSANTLNKHPHPHPQQRHITKSCAVSVDPFEPEATACLSPGELQQQEQQERRCLPCGCFGFLLKALLGGFKLFAAAARQRRLLLGGLGFEKGAAAGWGGEEPQNRGNPLLLPFPVSAFANQAEKLQERMLQGTVVLPEPLRPKNIESSKTSQVRNWLNVHFCLYSPPMIFLPGKRIELTNKDVASTAAALLFSAVLNGGTLPMGPSGTATKGPTDGPKDAPAEEAPYRVSPAETRLARRVTSKASDNQKSPDGGNTNRGSKEAARSFGAAKRQDEGNTETNHVKLPSEAFGDSQQLSNNSNMELQGYSHTLPRTHSLGQQQQQQQQHKQKQQPQPLQPLQQQHKEQPNQEREFGSPLPSCDNPCTETTNDQRSTMSSSNTKNLRGNGRSSGSSCKQQSRGLLARRHLLLLRRPAAARRQQTEILSGLQQPEAKGIEETNNKDSLGEKTSSGSSKVGNTCSDKLHCMMSGLALQQKQEEQQEQQQHQQQLQQRQQQPQKQQFSHLKSGMSGCLWGGSRSEETSAPSAHQQPQERGLWESGQAKVTDSDADHVPDREYTGCGGVAKSEREEEHAAKVRSSGAPSEGGSALGVDAPQEEDQYLSREILERFLKPDEAEEFMKHADLAVIPVSIVMVVSCHGKINKMMFQRAVLHIYSLRKRLVRALKSQASIASTVLRMMSLLLWFVTLIVLLLVMGVEMNTVVMSGAAFLSAVTVALSYIYQHFITAVIFVAFTNPYNIGDRVRIDEGDVLYVRRIRTYTTEFESMHGKPLIYSNASLFSRVITNESRAKVSTFELEVSLTLWLTCVEGWGNWGKVLKVRSEVYLHLVKALNELGISFHLPQQPVSILNRQTVACSSNKDYNRPHTLT
ncbi:hypothetical protein, conserved [Eimeria maxima]|uniref:Mechanosensitive ion channel MscS domain-containing protein n=1 Tax=Eimeria maxima TaxID=5804 RepID=U6MFR1_EIMMA|nr:hypothetical protein, conserved [Eimeria maxima]CDJ60495.1 hypothetical protein, conserved [Eimeria maxima]